MKRLKRYMREAALTQSQLADMLSVSQPTISDWLSGETKPSTKNLIDISRITRISIDELIGHRAF